MKKVIKLSLIDLKRSPDTRLKIRDDVVVEYTELYRAKTTMPLILVYDRRTYYVLADGRHRLAAMLAAGIEEAEVECKIGNDQMCYESSLIENAKHGIRYSKEEKVKIILEATKNLPGKSHRDIARLLGVSHTLVDQYAKVANVATHAETPLGNMALQTSGMPKPNNGTPNALPQNPTQQTAQTPPPKPEVVTDIMGYPIPIKVLPYFKRMEEIKKFINELHAIHRNIMIFADLRDVLWIGVNFQDVDVYTHNLVTALRRALPEVVCVQCQGHPEINPDNKCPRCHGKGLISKFDYDLPTVSDAMRKLREKAIDAITEKHKKEHEKTTETRQVAA